MLNSSTANMPTTSTINIIPNDTTPLFLELLFFSIMFSKDILSLSKQNPMNTKKNVICVNKKI